ncbi:MAG: four helix bundle protein [Verrucomicrobia bacterium]|nr:four helix bundle protein [Verrucomicrobiota bacterium]
MSTPAHTSEPRYDLEERLLNYAADIIRFTESMLKTDSSRHVSNQLMRSGAAPLGHQGEAVSAESSKDFIHKMKVALKELRESDRWLKLSIRVPLIPAKVSAKPLLQETDELIRIFVASIKTAQRNAAK